MSSLLLEQQFLGGGVGAAFIEDLFRAHTYSGNASARSINVGIEPDFVWIKGRSGTSGTASNRLFNKVRGANKVLSSNQTSAEATTTQYLTAFNVDGFSLGTDGEVNGSSTEYVSWNFKAHPDFYYETIYTGNGVAGRVIPLPGWTKAPGMVVVKRLDTTGDWFTWHRSFTGLQYIYLNRTDAVASASVVWNSTSPTVSGVTLGTDSGVNANGGTYLIQVFGHDDGPNGLIQCGSYTGNGSSAGPTVTLGWEPQWILQKNASVAASWILTDTTRGMPVSGNDLSLLANDTAAEFSQDYYDPQPTGFQVRSVATSGNNNGSTHIYVAIRRGPMRVPTSGTQVFNAIARTGTGAAATVSGVGFAPDLVLARMRASTDATAFSTIDRLRGRGQVLYTTSTAAEPSSSGSTQDLTSFDMDGFSVGTVLNSNLNNNASTIINECFRRAPGVFDQVCYTGTGVARTIAHNLGSVPGMMIIKSRSDAYAWPVYHSAIGAGSVLFLNNTNASQTVANIWNNTAPTSTAFTVGTNGDTNNLNSTYVAYLFGNTPGLCGTFSYEGSASPVTVNLGFTPRFIIVKCYSGVSTGWLIFDTVRGIVAGNDPYLELNSTAAENTASDIIDPTAGGFIANTGFGGRVNGGAGSFYCGWAIA